MQAAALISAPSAAALPLARTPPSKNNPASPWNNSVSPALQTCRSPQLTAKAAAAASETSTVDYGSMASSVFPAEACETIGGEACDVEMYPEVKLKPEANTDTAKAASELIDRDYFEYDGPKTVFPAEACDDLGGEFCQPEYQKGVY
ncbi:light-regulated protein, chloroplastic [Malania oleifera]|uniref:light-regulated protein, chloroplastic n=1 Tax=Malania oleifera TaxID=397392 RepID=UPI0025ADAEF4|nr:light-regulated protein, chloroplastic [Malania oleifera]